MTKTTTDSSIGTCWRPRILGAAIALLLVTAACSSTADNATTTSSATPAPTMTAVPAVETAVAVTTTTGTPPESSAVLAGALERYASSYRFTGIATVNGTVATVVSGRWVEAASQMTISSGDGEVEYVITPDGQWARLPDGTWEELDGVPPTANPLATLASPDSLELVAVDGTKVELRGMYPAAALGLAGDPVDVQLVFEDGELTQASYSVDIEGNVVEAVTTFAGPVDTTPIANPTG